MARTTSARLRYLMVRLIFCLWVIAWAAGMAWAEKPDQLPQPTSYVSDFAGVIDAASKQQLEDLSLQVYQKAHATIEVVTIKSLEGEPIEEFATALEDKWKVGAKGTDKGVLIILAIQDRKRRIEVGYGLEGILNDAKVGDIGRSVVPMLEQGQYGAALLSEEQQVANVIATDAGVTLDNSTMHTYHREPVRYQHRFSWFSLILFFIFALIIFGRRGGGGGGFLPWFILGNILGSRRGDYYDGDGLGGGSGGGSGGGGGNDDFGGGFGGGSGGGGASGDW